MMLFWHVDWKRRPRSQCLWEEKFKLPNLATTSSWTAGWGLSLHCTSQALLAKEEGRKQPQWHKESALGWLLSCCIPQAAIRWWVTIARIGVRWGFVLCVCKGRNMCLRRFPVFLCMSKDIISVCHIWVWKGTRGHKLMKLPYAEWICWPIKVSLVFFDW